MLKIVIKKKKHIIFLIQSPPAALQKAIPCLPAGPNSPKLIKEGPMDFAWASECVNGWIPWWWVGNGDALSGSFLLPCPSSVVPVMMTQSLHATPEPSAALPRVHWLLILTALMSLAASLSCLLDTKKVTLLKGRNAFRPQQTVSILWLPPLSEVLTQIPVSKGDNQLNSTHPGTLQTLPLNFSGGEVDKNPPANGGDMVLIPGLGRFHMPRNDKVPGFRYWIQTLEPVLYTEATAMKRLCTIMKSSPHLLQLEKGCTTRKTQCNEKFQKYNK